MTDRPYCGRCADRSRVFGGAKCNECFLALQRERDELKDKLERTEDANRYYRRLHQIADQKWGECVDELLTVYSQRDEARQVGRDLLCLGVCVSDTERMQAHAFMDRHPWLRPVDEY